MKAKSAEVVDMFDTNMFAATLVAVSALPGATAAWKGGNRELQPFCGGITASSQAQAEEATVRLQTYAARNEYSVTDRFQCISESIKTRENAQNLTVTFQRRV